MIYVSVDNDYHIDIAKEFIARFRIRIKNVTFISHPSNRNTKSLNNYNVINVKPNPLGFGYKKISHYLQYIGLLISIRKLIHFQCNDKLILITEQQINNSLYAAAIKKKGGEVWLLDEGLGFYSNNLKNNDNHKFKTIYIFLYNAIYCILNIPIKAKPNNEGRMFITIRDHLIDKIYSRFDIHLNRTPWVEIYKTDNPKRITYNKANVIYIGNDFSSWNLKEEEKDLAFRTLNKLINQFNKVYIKIHPHNYNAKDDIYDFYMSLQAKNIFILDNDLTIKSIIKTLKPKFVVGSISTVLLDAVLYGSHPVFTYHLLKASGLFDVYDSLLNSLKYNFIDSIDDISDQYDSNLLS